MSKYRIILDGKTYEMEVEKVDGSAVAAAKAAPKAAEPVKTTEPVKTASKVQSSAPTTGGNVVKSPMPGTILKVFANAGDTVKKGQSVLVLEAMKMENEIVSPRDGKITALYVAQGNAVQGNDALFEVGE